MLHLFVDPTLCVYLPCLLLPSAWVLAQLLYAALCIAQGWTRNPCLLSLCDSNTRDSLLLGSTHREHAAHLLLCFGLLTPGLVPADMITAIHISFSGRGGFISDALTKADAQLEPSQQLGLRVLAHCRFGCSAQQLRDSMADEGVHLHPRDMRLEKVLRHLRAQHPGEPLAHVTVMVWHSPHVAGRGWLPTHVQGSAQTNTFDLWL